MSSHLKYFISFVTFEETFLIQNHRVLGADVERQTAAIAGRPHTAPAPAQCIWSTIGSHVGVIAGNF